MQAYIRITERLTQTEMDILELLTQGTTRKEICQLRHVEESTLKSQVHSILQKLGKERLAEVIEEYEDAIRSVRAGRLG